MACIMLAILSRTRYVDNGPLIPLLTPQ
jgi:hypothetical protein